MSDKKTDKSSEEIKGEPVEELETEELDEAHGGGLRPTGPNFNTAGGRGDTFNTVYGGVDSFNTVFGGFNSPNDSPLKK